MGELRVACGNVSNLFEPGAVDRGPQSPAELHAKIDRVATVCRSLFAGAGPDLLGLAEIGTERIVDELATRLQGAYVKLWEGPGVADQTGIAILARHGVVAAAEPVATQRPTALARPRCLVSRLWLQGVAEPVLVAMNHWRSRMQRTGSNDRLDRMETARWLGDLLSATDQGTCVIVMGDFNVEPFEAPFSEVGLRGVRFLSSALWAGATPAYLYNCAWRNLCQPDTWELARRPGYVESKPKTSHDSSPPVVFDHVMVSGRALRGGPLRLLEATATYHSDETTTDLGSAGVRRPARWRQTQTGQWVGASDHFPLTVSFVIE